MKTCTPEELKEIVRLHGMWLRNEEGGARADLCGANLRGVDLTGANLRGVDLTGARLSYAYLSGVNLCEADLRNANLRGVDLHRANLHCANLSHADLRNVYLRNANLSGVNLRCANLFHADLRNTVLTGINLADANLTTCRGVQYVQFSFQGLGETSRQWSTVKVNGVWQVFCGCWSGTLEELKVRIEQEAAGVSPCFTASRRTGLSVMKLMCDESDAQYSPES